MKKQRKARDPEHIGFKECFGTTKNGRSFVDGFSLISSANNTYLFVCLRQCMYII